MLCYHPVVVPDLTQRGHKYTQIKTTTGSHQGNSKETRQFVVDLFYPNSMPLYKDVCIVPFCFQKLIWLLVNMN